MSNDDDISDDTDIDAVIDDYYQNGDISTISNPTLSHSPLQYNNGTMEERILPDKGSVKRVKILIGLMLGSFYTQYLVLESVKSSVYSKSSIAINVCISFVMFYVLLTLSKEPQLAAKKSNSDNKKDLMKRFMVFFRFGKPRSNSRHSLRESNVDYDEIFNAENAVNHNSDEIKDFYRVPLTPWIQGMGIFLNISLLGSVLNHTVKEFVFWISAGMVLYITYGYFHSVLAPKTKPRRRPKEFNSIPAMPRPRILKSSKSHSRNLSSQPGSSGMRQSKSTNFLSQNCEIPLKSVN